MVLKPRHSGFHAPPLGALLEQAEGSPREQRLAPTYLSSVLGADIRESGRLPWLRRPPNRH
ncbi:MAG: hypothetical protein ACREUG_15865 [Steroidobacteraceae bacterium]